MCSFSTCFCKISSSPQQLHSQECKNREMEASTRTYTKANIGTRTKNTPSHKHTPIKANTHFKKKKKKKKKTASAMKFKVTICHITHRSQDCDVDAVSKGMALRLHCCGQTLEHGCRCARAGFCRGTQTLGFQSRSARPNGCCVLAVQAGHPQQSLPRRAHRRRRRLRPAQKRSRRLKRRTAGL